MTNQAIPADKVRDLHRLADKVLANTDSQHCTAIALANLVKEAAPALPLPTLADMTPEERSECKWMQADTETWGRAVIILPEVGGERAVTLDRWGHVAYEAPDRVIPRPDLPRLDGWRLADHKKHGRVVVTNPTPNQRGNVCFTRAHDSDPRGFGWDYCTPAELTYIDTDQEADQ